MVHWPIDTNPAPPAGTPEDEIPDVKSAFETLAQLQNEGLVKYIGISNFGVQQMTAALATGLDLLISALTPSGVKIAVNQLPYGLFLRSIELEVRLTV